MTGSRTRHCWRVLFTLVGAAVLVPLTLFSGLADGQTPQTIVVTGWGGLWERTVKSTVIAPFEQQHKVKVVHTFNAGFPEMIAKLKAEKGNPTIDVFLTGAGFERIAADDGLVDDFEAGKMPHLADVSKDLVYKNRMVANSINGVGIGYHKNRVPRPPTSWLDFWDPAFKPVAVSDIRDTYGRALFARVNDLKGGTKENQEPAWGMFKELMRTKSPAINQTTDDTVNAIVARGAAISVAASSRVVQLMKEGYPVDFVYPKEGAFAWGTYMGIPAGTKKKDLAMAFINFWLDPQTQAQFAAAINYGPANVKTVMPADYQHTRYLVFGNTLREAYLLDFDYLNRNVAAWNERWAKEVLPLLNK